jgi:O-antigen ligase
VGGLGIFWIAAMAFLLAGYRAPALPWLPRLTWLYLALAGFYLLGRLLPGGLLPVDRFYVGAATANSLFWVWAVALAAGQSLGNKDLRTAWRLALAGVALAALFVAFFQARGWVSGWLPALIALVATLWMGSPRLAVAASLLGGLALLFDQAIVFRAVESLLRGENTYSLVTRLEAWRVLAEVIKVSPVLGLGPSNYYWYTPLFPILGWRVNFSSHNNYVDVAAQTGILGLVCLLWFAASMARLALRMRNTAPAGFERAYVQAAFGGLLGTMAAGMLADWFLPFVYNIGLSGFRMSLIGWVFLGGLVALARHRRGQPRKR